MKVKKIVVSTILCLLVSCASMGQPVIVDGTSARTTKNSIAKINKRLSSRKIIELQVALLRIRMSEVYSAAELIASKIDLANDYEFLGKKIHGLSYPQILELAEQSPAKARLISN